MNTVFTKEQTNKLLKDSNINTNLKTKEVIGTPLNNPLKELFCQYYSISLNASDSFLRARKELNYKDISQGSIHTIASTTLNELDVQERISELLQHTQDSLQINKGRIIEGIQNELEHNIADVFEWKDNILTLKDSSEIPVHIQKTIKSIKQTKDGIEVQFYDKQRAREQLMKYLGMLHDKLDVNVTHDLSNRLAQAHQRVLGRRGKGKTGDVFDPSEVQDASFEEVEE
jgi:hypothetical protein